MDFTNQLSGLRNMVLLNVNQVTNTCFTCTLNVPLIQRFSNNKIGLIYGILRTDMRSPALVNTESAFIRKGFANVVKVDFYFLQ